jgi:hypothetical protein
MNEDMRAWDSGRSGGVVGGSNNKMLREVPHQTSFLAWAHVGHVGSKFYGDGEEGREEEEEEEKEMGRRRRKSKIAGLIPDLSIHPGGW